MLFTVHNSEVTLAVIISRVKLPYNSDLICYINGLEVLEILVV